MLRLKGMMPSSGKVLVSMRTGLGWSFTKSPLASSAEAHFTSRLKSGAIFENPLFLYCFLSRIASSVNFKARSEPSVTNVTTDQIQSGDLLAISDGGVVSRLLRSGLEQATGNKVLCGRPVIDPSLPREEVNLIEWAMKLVKKGKLEESIDPFLEGKVRLEEMKKYCGITEMCLAQNGTERPTMGDLLWNLEFMLQAQAKDEKATMVDDKSQASVVRSTVQFSVNGMGDIAGVSMSKVFVQMVEREETR
ncbi:unnamed protein product [Thlaspi arvense]|uniref:Uncharacterized protein n=1 Tax=Thlaspi arvense TaxID=13288 RepID=A0AAU9RPZ6_THLAR|nr:unnamed protein product [Thlaspi arvense]